MDRVLGLLPGRIRRIADYLLGTWLGRVGLGFAWSLQRIEIFDRSMAVAAQLFTSVFPVLIMMASWFGNADSVLVDTFNMPQEAGTAVTDSLDDGGSTTFGIIGGIIVLASATSLSRALARAYAIIWSIPRPKSNIASAWRWVAVVLGLAIMVVVLRRMHSVTDAIPPAELWTIVLIALLYFAMGVLVPWILLKGVVTLRAVMTGAALFAVVMILVRPFSNVWLPHALEASAVRYGSIGVAFTYLAWFYIIAWIYLAAAVLGQVLVSDEGEVGRRLRGRHPLIRLDRAGETIHEGPRS